MQKADCLRIKPVFNLIRLLLSSNTFVILFISVIISLIFLDGKIFNPIIIFLFLYLTAILIMLFSFFMNYRATLYEISKEEIVFNEGFINHKHTSIEYQNIREISIKQNILQRIFKIGTIKIMTSASTGFSGLKLRDIINLFDVYNNIEGRITNYKAGNLISNIKPKFNIIYILLTYGLIGFVVTSIFFGLFISIVLTLIILFAGIIKHLKNNYKIFDNKIEYSFSFVTKLKGTIPREKIREIHIRQGFLQKILNMGQLLVVTSASGKKGSTLFNIPKPLDVKKQLSKNN